MITTTSVQSSLEITFTIRAFLPPAAQTLENHVGVVQVTIVKNAVPVVALPFSIHSSASAANLGQQSSTLSATWITPAPAGIHTISLNIDKLTPTGSLIILQRFVVVKELLP